jgi:hypothetical protein
LLEDVNLPRRKAPLDEQREQEAGRPGTNDVYTHPYIFATKGLGRPRRNQSTKDYFTTEARSSQSSEDFLMKKFLLRGLCASAVIHPNPAFA